MRKNLINVTDPRGKSVRCTKDCWYGHIIARHPKLTKSKNDVATTISKPDFINSDRFSSTAENYYRKGSDSNGEFYYRVTVEFDSGSGEVRTVFKCDSTKNGEAQIWP